MPRKKAGAHGYSIHPGSHSNERGKHHDNLDNTRALPHRLGDEYALYAERIKDITSISGIRSNQLIGYGLVVGLDGSGDRAPFTNQTFNNMMAQFGINLPPGVDPKSVSYTH